ncbi:MAG: sulfatase-like hydrolase/transferase [Phycisphaera sp.]|nr:sulfatase-like hydrolase/transferase [Phycisphaera sp.]
MTHRLIRCAAVAVAFVLLCGVCSRAALAEKPNIVLVMADDQGWGDVAYYGHPYMVTPNLDDLAKSGLRFDHFYAAAPVCSPTRASVMTGRHPNRIGVFKWGWPIRPQEITIAEALKTAGYATGHFGKWHLGSVRTGSPVNPGASGFDEWLSAPNFYDNDPILSHNGTAVQLTGESSDIAADAAIDFMKKQQAAGKPFLAVVWFGSPHHPHKAIAEDRAHYLPDHKDTADWAGEITGLDRAVGKLRAALRDMNVADNTVFWYCSDNGGLRTESSGGRGKKGVIYEGGLRVPGIIEWPSHIKQPRVTALPTNTSDIYPTLLDIVGVKMDKQPPLDGVSLLPLIDGKEMTHPAMGFWDYAIGGVSTPTEAMMKELLDAQKNGNASGDVKWLRKDAGDVSKRYPTDAFPGHAAWTDWPWKLHRIEAKGGKVTMELYNLVDDPMEANDVLRQNTDRANEMAHQLKQWQLSVVNSLNGKDY